MNTGTWVLWVHAPEKAPNRFIMTANDIAPDWRKSVFDFV
jgi:hypothetical protein